MEHYLQQLTIPAAVSKYLVYWFHRLCELADLLSIYVTSSLIFSDLEVQGYPNISIIIKKKNTGAVHLQRNELCRR